MKLQTNNCLSLFVTIIITSCKKDKDQTPTIVTSGTPNTGGTVFMNFANMVGDSALVFNTKSYTTANNDTFAINTFKY